MSEDGLIWIKHDGGPMPVPGDTVVATKWGAGGYLASPDRPQPASKHIWSGMSPSASITEYAIVTPSPSAVAPEPAIDAHYTKHAIEPMEYSMANKLDAMQHTVVKYVTRFRDKHGKRDLLAARHVLDMLIAREYPNG